MRKKWGNDPGADRNDASEHRVYMLRKLLMAQQRQQMRQTKKKQQAQMILRARLRKVALLPELPCMIHLSSKTMTLTISLAPIWNLRSPQI